jgi:hypothetical protein
MAGDYRPTTSQEKRMKRCGHRAVAVVSLLCTAFVGLPAASAHDGKSKPVDAKLYEVTENMSLEPNVMAPTLRTATAALQGTAKLGSPLCPVDLIHLLFGLGLLTRADKPCTVTAVGNDAIETATGSGSVDGTFAVVINLDNATDSPEFVVMTGEFAGKMQVAVDTSVNPPRQLPLINLTDGTFTPNEVFGVPINHIGMICLEPTKSGTFCLDPARFGPAPFTGVFRLPFTVDKRGWRHRAHSSKEAFYLGDQGQLIKVQPDERSLGFPTVRVEIDF